MRRSKKSMTDKTPQILHYQCTLNEMSWEGQAVLMNMTEPYQMKVTARETQFNVIFGKSFAGNYLVIPDWNIGTQLSYPGDTFWNKENLMAYFPELSEPDAISIVQALAAATKYIQF